MKKFIDISLLGIMLMFSKVSIAHADVAWKVSPERSKVTFKVDHFVLLQVEGVFSSPQGELIAKNEDDFSGAMLEAKIPVSTIDTGNIDRDTHLKQEIFFNVDKYPEMKFKSKTVIKKSDSEYEMRGYLTIRDTTLPVTFKVENLGIRVNKKGVTRSRFLAKGRVDRYKFGLKWNELTEAGAMVVGENVDIEMNVTLEKIHTSIASK